MQLAVAPQAAGVLEGLAAFLAHIGPLPGVLAQVVLVVGAPFEGEGAVGALEGTHTSMDLLRAR